MLLARERYIARYPDCNIRQHLYELPEASANYPSAGVKSIGTDAFYGASSLTQAVLPAGLESIGDGAFYGCESLSAINLTDTQIKHLGAYSFCLRGLTSVTLPDTLGIVGEYAFAECAGLVALTLSANTLWLKGYAFMAAPN